MKHKPLRLETKIIILVWSMVALALLSASYLITKNLATTIQNNISENTTNIAHLTAMSPLIVGALNNHDSYVELQEYCLQTAQTTKSQFVVVFDMNSVRMSHPNSEKIGQHIVGGDEQAVLAGKEYISISKGTMGDSLRAFSPVYDHEGHQIGAVVVGVLLNNVQQTVDKSQQFIYLSTALGLLIGAIGALLLARNIKKTLLGLEPFAIAHMVEERNAMLYSVREGIIAIDHEANITLINHEAMRLLNLAGIQGDPIGKSVLKYVPNTLLDKVLLSGTAQFDQEQHLNGVNLLTNRLPIIVNKKIVGAIATFRDMTEVRSLAEELTGVSSYVEALRAQAHEFMNKMQVVLGMIHMECYDQLAEYVRRIASEHKVEINFVGKRIRDAVIAGFILSKISQGRELGIEFTLQEQSYLPESTDPNVTHNLVTILGNLLSNAFDSMEVSPQKHLTLLLQYEDNNLKIQITDTGIGMDDMTARQIFQKGFSTKDNNRGLGMALVKANLELLHGTIEFFSSPGKGTIFYITIPYRNKGEKHV